MDGKLKQFRHKTFIVLFFSVLLIISCTKEENPNLVEGLLFNVDSTLLHYSEYEYISEENLSLQFYEDFSNNSADWPEYNDRDKEIRVDDGKLFFQSKDNYYYYYYKTPVNYANSKNYQIEVELKLISNEEDKLAYFRWGGLDGWDNNYGFEISNEGEFSITHHKNDERTEPIVPSTESNFIRLQEYNKLTIRYIQPYHYFFINENFVGRSADIILYGSEIGPSVGSYSECEFDNVKIEYIEL